MLFNLSNVPRHYWNGTLSVRDFSAQAVVNTILNRTFPGDPIVGEEDAADLRVDSGKALRERIVQLANETLTAELLPGEKEEWGLGPKNGRTTDELLCRVPQRKK